MSTNQSWGGRFAEGPREAVAAYTDSQTYDRALYAQDIRGSQAHARMLGRQGVITPEEAEQIVNGLDAVKQEIESGAFVWKPALEDVHMNIEARLTEIIGDVGKKLHTGRSRNDQVGLTFRLFVADRLTAWQQLAFRVGVQVDVVGLGRSHETGLQRRHLGLVQIAPQPGAQHGHPHDGAEEQGHFPAGGFLLAHARSCSQVRSCSIWRATERGPVPAGVSRRRTAAA